MGAKIAVTKRQLDSIVDSRLTILLAGLQKRQKTITGTKQLPEQGPYDLRITT